MAVVPFATQVRGVKTGRAVLAEEANRVQAARLTRVYESHEFLVPSPTTAESIRTIVDHAVDCSCQRASGAFGLIARAQRVQVRNVGNGQLQVRFTDPDEDPISLDAGEYLDWDFHEVTDVFLSNAAGVAIPVRISMG